MITLFIFFSGCNEDDIEGCMNIESCNYNTEANIDDGSCIYPEENFDCDEYCIVEYDCLGVCGGDALEDNCGTCDNYPNNDCNQDCFGSWGGTAVEDCNNDCFDSFGNLTPFIDYAEVDSCGVCSGGSTGQSQYSDKDCAGDCFGEAFLDDCDVCSEANTKHRANSDKDCGQD